MTDEPGREPADNGDEPTVVTSPDAGEVTRPLRFSRTPISAGPEKTRGAVADEGPTRPLRPRRDPAESAEPGSESADPAVASAERAGEGGNDRDQVGEGGNDRDQVGEGQNDRDQVGEGRNDRDRAGASEDPGGETVLLSAPAAGERAAQDTATGAGEGPGHDGGPEGAGSLDRVNAGDEPAVDGGREPLRERLGSEPGSSDGVPIKAHEAGGAAGERGAAKAASRRTKPTPAGALIWVLLALLGFTLVVQLRSNNDDQGLASARQEDLVSILSDLESRDSRLQGEITSLEQSQRQLTSGVSSRQAALAEAQKRSDELGLLAGTLPGKGPGLKIMIDKVKASSILNAVEELRGSGGEVMELAGDNGATVRIVASSYFVDAQGGGILVDGVRLTGPWTLWVIGPPQTMQPALQIQGGVVASVQSGGGSVTMEAQTLVQVTAVRKATTLQYAHPAS